jgi:maleylacetate reductase
VSDLEFVYESQPGRVVFGPGSVRHAEREVVALGSERAIVLCTRSQRATADAISAQLGARSAGLFDRVEAHVPIELAREARAIASERRADCAIAVGGGSTIGLGKAIALDSGLPIVAVPTTYAGSEMTPIFGITEAGRKRTGTDLRVLPRTVIYDPELTLTLPIEVTVTSAINALAHAAEGLYARDANPITSLMAEEAIRAIAEGLPAVHEDTADLAGRGRLLYGAWLAGSVLGSVGMALHHKLCHVLGGTFDLPHAATHTVVLPHVLAFNAPAAPAAMTRIARGLGTDEAPLGVYELARRHGAPLALRDLGMSAEDLDAAADIASADPYWNPRPFDRADIRTVLQNAFEGAPPGA